DAKKKDLDRKLGLPGTGTCPRGCRGARGESRLAGSAKRTPVLLRFRSIWRPVKGGIPSVPGRPLRNRSPEAPDRGSCAQDGATPRRRVRFARLEVPIPVVHSG